MSRMALEFACAILPHGGQNNQKFRRATENQFFGRFALTCAMVAAGYLWVGTYNGLARFAVGEK